MDRGNSTESIKGSKQRLRGRGLGRLDADAPLHILTFRSLWTMSCWWMWWTLSRIWWIQWLWRQNREEGQLVGGEREGHNGWWAQRGKSGAKKTWERSRDVHAGVSMRWKIQEGPVAEKRKAEKMRKNVVWKKIFTWRGDGLVGAGEGDKKFKKILFF